MRAVESRSERAAAGLLIRMSLEERETVHALARASGMTARAYVLGLVEDDLRRRRAREAAGGRVSGL